MLCMNLKQLCLILLCIDFFLPRIAVVVRIADLVHLEPVQPQGGTLITLYVIVATSNAIKDYLAQYVAEPTDSFLTYQWFNVRSVKNQCTENAILPMQI